MSIEYWKRTAEFWKESAEAEASNGRFWHEMYTTLKGMYTVAKELNQESIARRDDAIKDLRAAQVDVVNANIRLDIENQDLRKQLREMRAELGTLRRQQRRRPF